MVKLTNLDNVINNANFCTDKGVYTYELCDSVTLFFNDLKLHYTNVFNFYSPNRNEVSFSFIKDGKVGEARFSPTSCVRINPRDIYYLGSSKPDIALWKIQNPGFVIWGAQPIVENDVKIGTTYEPLDPVAVRQFLNLDGNAVPVSHLKDATAPSNLKPRIYDTPRVDTPKENVYDDTKKEAFINKGTFNKTETSYYLPIGSHYKHIKRGSVVKIAAIASLQIKDENLDMLPMVVYTHDNHTWVRPVDEFLDGRFIPLDEKTAASLQTAQKEKAKIDAVAREHGITIHDQGANE